MYLHRRLMHETSNFETTLPRRQDKDKATMPKYLYMLYHNNTYCSIEYVLYVLIL